jgi:type IV secretion system protein VirB6
MACPAVSTGSGFLGSVLGHVECQAQSIGAFGYGALAANDSPVSGVLLALLTIFIAVFAIRLLLGDELTARDGASAVLKIGIVLTLATSWPAWRTLAYDVVIKAPSQVAAGITQGSGLSFGQTSLDSRLQRLDDGLVALTTLGTGRLTGGITGSSDIGDSPNGIAIADQSGFGLGRVAFLAGVIGPIAVVRLGGGVLLALAPVVAGLLLFGATRSLFFGYLRALAFCAVGTLMLAVVYASQIALMEPWLRDAFEQRGSNVLTPAAPTELLVLALAFALAAFSVLGLAAKWLFFAEGQAAILPAPANPQTVAAHGSQVHFRTGPSVAGDDYSRARTVADAVATSLRREERQSLISGQTTTLVAAPSGSPASRTMFDGTTREPLGSSYRRAAPRRSAAARKRDQHP